MNLAVLTAALLILLITLAIVLVLVGESFRFFRHIPIGGFLFGSDWSPGKNVAHYGVWPLLGGSLEIMIVSAALALPVGILTAVYLSEYASRWSKKLLSLPLDLLAGIPAVVYGYLALFLVTPALHAIFPSIQASNALSAAIVVAIMILPLIASLVQDAMSGVSDSLRESGYALGMTKAEVIWGIVLPNCRSSVAAAYVLAMSRAIGETMAITLAAGSTPNNSLDPLKSTETLTSYILTTSLGDVSVDNLRYLSIYAVGLLLFVITYAASFLTGRMRRQRLRSVI